MTLRHLALKTSEVKVPTSMLGNSKDNGDNQNLLMSLIASSLFYFSSFFIMPSLADYF